MYLKTGLQREIIATTRLSRTSQIFLACEKLVYYFITIFFPYYMYINRVNVFQCIVVVNFICNLFYIISGFHCGHGFLCEVFLPLHINAWTRMGTGLLWNNEVIFIRHFHNCFTYSISTILKISNKKQWNFTICIWI